MHSGKDYTATFCQLQRGSGPYAYQIASGFKLARRRLGLQDERLGMRTDLFVRPAVRGQQLTLF